MSPDFIVPNLLIIIRQKINGIQAYFCTNPLTKVPFKSNVCNIFVYVHQIQKDTKFIPIQKKSVFKIVKSFSMNAENHQSRSNYLC